MDTYEIKRQIQEAKESIEYVEQAKESIEYVEGCLDEMAEASSQWEQIEGEGYYDASEVLETISNLSDWQEFYDRNSLEPDEVEERLKALSLIEEAAEAGEAVTDEDAAKALVESLKGGVLDALQLLIAELRNADILPRTEAVPAASNNTESTNTHSISATSEVEFSPGDSVNSNPVSY